MSQSDRHAMSVQAADSPTPVVHTPIASMGAPNLALGISAEALAAAEGFIATVASTHRSSEPGLPQLPGQRRIRRVASGKLQCSCMNTGTCCCQSVV